MAQLEPMTYAQRTRLIEEQTKKFVSRNKCVDASLQTFITQARASSRPTPQAVAAVQNRDGCAANVMIAGKGTNGEYLGLLMAAQNCAICPDTPNLDPVVYPVATLPTPCNNMLAPPFTQQNLSTMYVAPCTDPGIRGYFPTKANKGDTCNAKHLPYDSA